MPKRVAVIGAGIAGLTAAHDMSKAGFDVEIFERDDFSGGRMADVNIKGLNVHTGATIIWSFYRDMMDLVRELGMADELVDYQSEFTLDNGVKEFPISITPSPALLLRNPAILIASKARLATLLPDMIASGLKTDPNFLHTAKEYDDGESIADYIKRKVGEDFLENYVAPLFRIPWSWNVEDISKAYLLSVFGHLTTARTMSFKSGIGALTRALAAKVPVRNGAEVLKVEESLSGVKVTYVQDGESRTAEAELAILATQGNKVAGIIAGRGEDPFFQSVKYNRCAIVYYLLKNPPPPRDRWFSREHPCRIPFYAQIPEDPFTPDGRQRPHLYCELTPEVIDEIDRAGLRTGIRAFVDADARTLFPALEDELDDVVEQWIDEMLPVIYPGYVRKLAGFLEAMELHPSRIYFCGDYLSHSHTGGACASGRRAARLVKAHHRN